MIEATKTALEVFSLGFVISMVVALLIKLTFNVIQHQTKTK